MCVWAWGGGGGVHSPKFPNKQTNTLSQTDMHSWNSHGTNYHVRCAPFAKTPISALTRRNTASARTVIPSLASDGIILLCVCAANYTVCVGICALSPFLFSGGFKFLRHLKSSHWKISSHHCHYSTSRNINHWWTFLCQAPLKVAYAEYVGIGSCPDRPVVRVPCAGLSAAAIRAADNRQQSTTRL